jgi:RNA polymerase sigma factor (sigma-70 family)
MDDSQLLQEFVKNGSETAFRELVTRHLNLVYSSALRQLNDNQLAEEVVQTVFILLARKAARLRRGIVLSGWLFRTTRFVATRAWRGESRRRLREQKAFDMQSTLTSDETWKRIAPTLDEALAKLGETDRNVVLLHFMEERTHAQVGSALGLSEEAARKRSDRALEKLRGFFASRGFSISAAVFGSALLANAVKAAPTSLANTTAAAAVKFSAGAAATLPALTQQAIQAWRWTKIKWAAIAGSAAMLSAVIVTHTLQKPIVGAAAIPGSKQSTATPGDVAAAARVNAVNPADASAASPNAAATANVLHFHAADRATGKPVPYAKLAVLTWINYRVDASFDFATDASGNCDVPVTPGLGRLDVGVLSPGWAARFATWRIDLDVVPGAYTLRVDAVTNSIGGWLRDEAGNPVANAKIVADFMGTGDASWREAPRERFGFVGPVELATTDLEGHWSCTVIPLDNPGFTLEAHPQGLPQVTIGSFQPNADGESAHQLWAGNLTTTVPRGIALSGQVTDSSGQPITDAKIEHAPGSTESLTARSDSNGRFAISNLTAGEFNFVVSAKRFSPEYKEVNVTPGLASQTIQLQPSGHLLLRVVDSDGLTVPDATVGLQALGDHNNAYSWKAKTDAEGRIEWDSAPAAETMELYAYKDGWCFSRQIQLKADGQEHTITMQRALHLSGKVVDATTGNPISVFKVVPGYGEGSGEFVWHRGNSLRGKNGEFAIDLTEARQPWHVTVEAEGYESLVSDAIPPYFSQTLVLQMKPVDIAKSVRGIVLLPDGKPAAGAQVVKLTLDYHVRLGNGKFDDHGVGTLLMKTDEHGNFMFPTDLRMHSVAAVSAEGYAKLRIHDASHPVTLRLQKWGRVEGTVAESERSRPIEFVELMDDTAMNYEGSVEMDPNYFHATPDAEGHFSFERVPPGRFSVYIMRRVGIPLSCQTVVMVNEGETSVAQVGGKGSTVVGRFTSTKEVNDWTKNIQFASLFDLSNTKLSRPPEGLSEDATKLWAVDFWQSKEGIEACDKNRSSGVIIAADGTFRAEDVMPGEYTLTAFGQGASVNKKVTVPEGSADLDLGTIRVSNR